MAEDGGITAVDGGPATKVAAEKPRLLAVDLSIDVCVVGADAAALTAAIALARRGFAVACLAEGRIEEDCARLLPAFIRPGFAGEPERLVARVGLAHARSLWALAAEGVEALGQGGSRVCGHLTVFERHAPDATRRRTDAYRALGADAEVWSTERVRATLATGAFHQAVHVAAVSRLDAGAHLAALVADARAAGVRIYEQTPALAIDADGIRKRVRTPRAVVRTERLILSGTASAARHDARIRAALIPLTQQSMLTEPSAAVLGAIRFRGSVQSSDHFRAHAVGHDGALIWSRLASAHARGAAKALRREIAAVYPQLTRLPTAHVWSATRYITAQRMPMIEELSPGYWVAAGIAPDAFGHAAMAGNLIARAITREDDRWRLFAPFGVAGASGASARRFVGAMLHVRSVASRLRARLAHLGWMPVESSTQAEGEPLAAPAAVVTDVVQPAIAVPTLPQVGSVAMPPPESPQRPHDGSGGQRPTEARATARSIVKPRAPAKKRVPSPREVIVTAKRVRTTTRPRKPRTPAVKPPPPAPETPAN